MDKSPSSSGSSGSSRRDVNTAASGCGSSEIGTIQLNTPPPPPPPITLNITTTTGGSFTVLVDVHNTVENLKKIIAKKLKVAKDRICLLHRERELQVGTLKENGLLDGSKIILIPNVETGLLAQRPENTVMQALESLNDAQVNDFLSGKTPLNLSMRLGDHMMLIQLQLSTVNPSSPSHSRSRSTSRNVVSSKSPSTFPSSNSMHNNGSSHHAVPANTSRHTNSSLGLDHTASTSSGTTNSISSVEEIPTDSFPINHINVDKVHAPLAAQVLPYTSSGNALESTTTDCCSISSNTSSFSNESQLEQSPIKSLSNLVSSPMKTTPLASIPSMSSNYAAIDTNSSFDGNESRANIETASSSPPLSCSDPISAKLTSCLCKRLLGGSSSSSSTATTSNVRNCDLNHCQTRQDTPISPIMSPCGSAANDGDVCSRKALASSTPNVPLKQSTNSSFLHKTANNPILRSKHIRHHHHHGHHSSHNQHLSSNATAGHSHSRKSSGIEKCRTISTMTENVNAEPIYEVDDPMAGINATDSRALAEASRNLTQTLRKLSKEVFTSKVDLSEETPRKSSSGAVIESMKNHGKGIYSGTFSGTLNPALQDRFGRPKRDISTVIHILNDLLSATPQYSRGARICFETPSTSKSNTAKSKLCSVNEGCNKCCNSTKTNSCVYGECNGHYSSANANNIATTSAQRSCHHHNPATTNDACSCCGRDSGFSFETSQSLTRSEFSSLVSSGSEINSLNTSLSSSSSSSCTCSFLQNICDTNMTETLQDSNAKDKNICSKCIAEQENNKTKCKLDQLRLVMQQSKERREARKLKGAPYGARVLSTSTTSSSNSGVPTAATSANSPSSATTIAPLASPSEVSPNHIVEEVNTAA